MMPMSRLIPLAILAALLPAAAGAAVTCDPATAQFQRPDGTRQPVAVELADTPDERAQGLMFRRALAPGHGMLFIYESPQPVAFWMKNTLIPLDMLFIDPNGRVAHVHEGAVPHDETPIPGADADDPAPARLMVLELAAGEADRLDLHEGAVLAHPRLPQGTAALPCE